MTIYLELSGAEKDQIAAIKTAHPDMVAKDESGKEVLGNVNTHDIALIYVDLFLGNHFIMVKFLNNQKLPSTLPGELTQKWKSGGAPVIWPG